METPPENQIPLQETTACIENPDDINLTVRALERAAAGGEESARDLAERTAASLEGAGEAPVLTLNLNEAMVTMAALSRHPKERFRPRSAKRREYLARNLADMVFRDIKTSALALKQDSLLWPRLESSE